MVLAIAGAIGQHCEKEGLVMRKVWSVRDGLWEVIVYRDSEWQQYKVVTRWSGGDMGESKYYYTTDRQDAIDTAGRILEDNVEWDKVEHA